MLLNQDFWMYLYKTVWCPFTEKYLNLINNYQVMIEEVVCMLIMLKISGETRNSLSMSRLIVNIGKNLQMSKPMSKVDALKIRIANTLMDGKSRSIIQSIIKLSIVQMEMDAPKKTVNVHIIIGMKMISILIRGLNLL